ncbi:LLM class flavin-dependent oxidoreductase, partial [Staphylococcus aureus]
MGGLRFGFVDALVHSRLPPTLPARSSLPAATVMAADSYWVGDHLHALVPRSIATSEYLGIAAKFVPKLDANYEPWTMLGTLAFGLPSRLRLGVCVTDAGRRNPAVTAQAAATLHLLT